MGDFRGAQEKVIEAAVLALSQLSSRQVLIIYRRLDCFIDPVEIFYRIYFINMEQGKCLPSLLAINLYMLSCRALGREITGTRVQEFLGMMNWGIGLLKMMQKETAFSARAATG